MRKRRKRNGEGGSERERTGRDRKKKMGEWRKRMGENVKGWNEKAEEEI